MASPTLLKTRDQLQTEAGMPCIVEELLGKGSQGEVYRVDVGGRKLALKWYMPTSATHEQKQALIDLIKRGRPDDRFLWPLFLATSRNHPEFGYLMPLRDKKYYGILDLMKRRVVPTFRSLCTTSFNLADSYARLHSMGLCYRDISFGNVFFNPENGNVLICDNDNVTINGNPRTSITGTPRFISPEIMTKKAPPSTNTDLYSLSVLLFYLLMSHHPLEGKAEADVAIFDLPAQKRIFEEHPVFIFDPNDTSNRPVPGYQQNALIFWPLYPQFIRDMFTRAFTNGLRDPENGRVREIEWRNAMIRLRDSIYYCPDARCGAENFYDLDLLTKSGKATASCWRCKKSITLPFRIRIGDAVIMLNRDTQLFPHHIHMQRKWDFSQPTAEVNRHPTDPNIWGLRNLSQEKWVLVLSDGTMKEVEPGRSAPLAAGNKIQFGSVQGEIRY